MSTESPDSFKERLATSKSDAKGYKADKSAINFVAKTVY